MHSLRGVFGLGRTARAKIMPFLLVGVMMLPAVVSIAIMALIKQEGLGYTEYAVIMQAVLAIFLASQSPYTGRTRPALPACCRSTCPAR